MLTDQDSWEAVWERIAEVIDDHPNNSNNRFDASADGSVPERSCHIPAIQECRFKTARHSWMLIIS